MRINPKPTKRQLTLAQIAFAALSLLLESATLTVNAQPFSMPEEQINYTITQKDGAMWAKIDGKYPITYTGNETIIPMIYPTPPGTTNISVWMNDTKVSWSNFAEANPEALHHTAIGDWSEILTVLENVTDGFVLRIHYEHPLQVINGSYAFLYDLNIQEYLSAMSNLSVAHFTIAMEVNYTDLKVNTVDPRTETLKPIEYVTRGYENKVIEIDEVSEFGKTLPGDLLCRRNQRRQHASSCDRSICRWTYRRGHLGICFCAKATKKGHRINISCSIAHRYVEFCQRAT
jgi:hypothetical protein